MEILVSLLLIYFAWCFCVMLGRALILSFTQSIALLQYIVRALVSIPLEDYKLSDVSGGHNERQETHTTGGQ